MILYCPGPTGVHRQRRAWRHIFQSGVGGQDGRHADQHTKRY